MSSNSFFPLPFNNQAPQIARNLLRSAFPAATDAYLLVSEIVTNAVIHGTAPIAISWEESGGVLTVRVTDSSSREPAHHTTLGLGIWAEHGRGMDIVHKLSSKWGVETTDQGKAVWFALAISELQAGEAS